MGDLIYIGDGAWLAGVPARDLSASEVAECGRAAEELVASGLYQTSPQHATKARGSKSVPTSAIRGASHEQ